MSDENKDTSLSNIPTSDSPELTEPTPENEAQKAEFNFKALVKARVAEAQPNIKDNVIKTFADQEVARIEAAIIKTVKDLDEARVEFNKLKPDDEKYDGEGKLVSATFTKAGAQKKQEAKKKVANLETALELALVKGDYSKVLNLAGGKKDQPAQ